jgi:hypothetical protein
MSTRFARRTGFGLVALLGLGAATGGCFFTGYRSNGYGTTTYAAPPPAPVMPMAPTSGTPIMQGQALQGVLDGNGLVLPSGAAADDYVIQLTAGVPVVITTMGGASYNTSSSLDVFTYLYFNGSEVAHDDDSAGNLNSRIYYTPMYSGTYVIRVTTWGSGLRIGPYTLAVQ